MNVKSDFEPIALATFLPYRITLLADRIARRTAEIARRHDGLNLSQWRVLAAIAEMPGRTANDVVSMTPMDKGIVSRAVKSLLDVKLIVRKASKEDGRLGHLFLTPKGARRYEAIAEEIKNIENAMTSVLSKDEAEMLPAVLSKLLTKLAP